jgi:hypothetical protein
MYRTDREPRKSRPGPHFEQFGHCVRGCSRRAIIVPHVRPRRSFLPSRRSRKTLPSTAERDNPPSRSPITAAVSPWFHIVRSTASRSAVQKFLDAKLFVAKLFAALCVAADSSHVESIRIASSPTEAARRQV